MERYIWFFFIAVLMITAWGFYQYNGAAGRCHALACPPGQRCAIIQGLFFSLETTCIGDHE